MAKQNPTEEDDEEWVTVEQNDGETAVDVFEGREIEQCAEEIAHATEQQELYDSPSCRPRLTSHQETPSHHGDTRSDGEARNQCPGGC